MPFSSLLYPFFLFAAVLLYYTLPQKKQSIFILSASVLYYALFGLRFLFILAGIALMTYLTGLWIGKKTDDKVRFVLSVLLVLLPLFLFKYLHFLSGLLLPAFSVHFQAFARFSPVGISFFTFQCLAYLIDIHRDTILPEKSLLSCLCFFFFFPQLTSGPISRAHQLLPQLKSSHSFSLSSIQEGSALLLWGYFEKFMVADRIALYSDPVFNNWQLASGRQLLLALLLYAFQIYADFSGYSHLALGSAKMFGITLPDNFHQPYLADSIKDFWRRWHITLSAWLRDYLYIPLGGSRKGKLRQAINLTVVFLVSGLWHGASLSFLVWGGLHAMYQIIETFLPLSRLPKLIRRILAFLAADLAWIFFRMSSCSSAIGVLLRIPRHFFSSPFPVDFSAAQWMLLGLSFLLLACIDLLHENGRTLLPNASFFWRRGFIVLIGAALVLIFGIWGGYMQQSFIYFQF